MDALGPCLDEKWRPLGPAGLCARLSAPRQDTPPTTPVADVAAAPPALRAWGSSPTPLHRSSTLTRRRSAALAAAIAAEAQRRSQERDPAPAAGTHERARRADATARSTGLAPRARGLSEEHRSAVQEEAGSGPRDAAAQSEYKGLLACCSGGPGAWGGGSAALGDLELPYELRALEGALAEAVRLLDYQASGGAGRGLGAHCRRRLWAGRVRA